MSTKTEQFQNDLLQAVGNAEEMLELWDIPHWKVCLVVWNPDNHDECLSLAPASMDHGDVIGAVTHALRQKETKR